MNHFSLICATLVLFCGLSPHAYALQLDKIWNGISLKSKSIAKSVAVITISQSLLIVNPSPLPPTANAMDAKAIDNAPKYGLKKGRLLPCKSESNCISSSSIKSYEKYGRPWAFPGEPDAQFEKILSALKSDPYLKLAESDPATRYVRAEAKSAVPPTGVDDVEFLINSADKIITYRSNSRELVRAGMQVIGDAGSNKNRLEGIKRKLGVSEMQMDADAEAFVKEISSLGIIESMRYLSEPSDINFLDNSVPETRGSATSSTTPSAVVSEQTKS